MTVIFSVVLTLVTVFSLLLNSLVLSIFYHIRDKIDAKDILLVSLAISDLLQSIFGYPLEIVTAPKGKWIFGSDACIFSGFSVTFLGLVSISHLVCLAAERYISIAKPFLAERITRKPRYTVFISIVSWIYAFFWAILPVLGISSYTLEGKTRCSLNWKGKSRADRVYICLLFVFCFVLPVFMMGIFSISVAKELRRMLKSALRQTGKQSQMVKDTYTACRSNSVLVLIMITAFLMAWTPYAALSLKSVVSPNSYLPRELGMAAAILAKSSPMLNAVIYTLVYKKFRGALRKFFKRTWKKNKVVSADLNNSTSVTPKNSTSVTPLASV